MLIAVGVLRLMVSAACHVGNITFSKSLLTKQHSDHPFVPVHVFRERKVGGSCIVKASKCCISVINE